MDLRPHREQTRARAPAAGLKTWDDFVRLEEDDLRELIDGKFVEIEVPTDLHEWIVLMMGRLLLNWALSRKAGIAFASGYKVRISARRGVMPDVQFYRKAIRPGETARGSSAAAPTWWSMSSRPPACVTIASRSPATTSRSACRSTGSSTRSTARSSASS